MLYMKPNLFGHILGQFYSASICGYFGETCMGVSEIHVRIRLISGYNQKCVDALGT